MVKENCTSSVNYSQPAPLCRACSFCILHSKSNFLYFGTYKLYVCPFCRKKLFSAVHMFIHLNLSISLLLGYLTFMIGIETATSSTVSIEQKLLINNYLDRYFLNILTNQMSLFNYHYADCLCTCGSPAALFFSGFFLLDVV